MHTLNYKKIVTAIAVIVALIFVGWGTFATFNSMASAQVEDRGGILIDIRGEGLRFLQGLLTVDQDDLILEGEAVGGIATTTIGNPWLFTDLVTFTGTTTNSNGYSNENRFETYYTGGDFADATNTLAVILSPFRATSTVTVSQLAITSSASTSQNFYIGTTTDPTAAIPLGCTVGAPTVCDGVIIDEALVATSSAPVSGTWSGHLATMVGAFGNFINITDGDGGRTGASITSLVVGPDEFVVIYSTSTFQLLDIESTKDGITGSDNTFTGNYSLEFIRTKP